MMRRIAVVMLVCVVAVSMLGVTIAQAEKKVKIGAAMADFSDKWLSYLHDGVNAFGEKCGDCEIFMTDGKADPAQQLNQIETLLTQGVDVIAVVPVDISTMGPIVATVKDAGVPLVVINRLPEEEFMGDVDVYCGSESIQAGIMQGEWIAEALGEKGGRIGIITGMPGHEAAMMRTAGNMQVFDKHDNIEVVVDTTGKWDRALGMQVTENWIQAGHDLDAIVCNNDEMAIGAVLASRSAGMKDEDVLIAGVDATPDALEYLGQGLDVTVFQSAHGQGYSGMEAAYKLAKGEAVEKMQWFPYELVTVENMKDYE
jgi:inositol transport system substrate-binding protein